MRRKDNSMIQFFCPGGRGRGGYTADFLQDLRIKRGFKPTGGLKEYSEDLNQLED